MKSSHGPERSKLSLSEVHGTVHIPYNRGFLRRLLAVSGPAFLVAVGYMDPGNWATDLAAGSGFNYTLLWVLLMSNVMAVLLQSLAFRLGIVRGLDLAQACRVEYSRFTGILLYILGEIAITACDLAEVLGSAIALQLLFGLPLLWGVLITATDTFALLFLSRFGIRKIEAFILSLITVIAVGLFFQVFLAKPDLPSLARGFIPSLPNSTALFIAIGMLGATVMPHNLYLHSSLVQSRRVGDTAGEKRQAIKFNTIDSALALNMAFLVNASLLVLAAGAFYRHGYFQVSGIQDAHELLRPILGTAIAPIAFAVALLASGQASTITGTLAGQIVMEGFLNFRLPPWIRRLITRLLAIVPAALAIVYFGEGSTGNLLVMSQVVLSLQLPFAVIPLIHFVSDRKKMGAFALGRTLRVLAWLAAAVIVALNIKLVADTIGEWIGGAGGHAIWLMVTVVPLTLALGALLIWVTVKPFAVRVLERRPAEPPSVHEPAEDIRIVLETKEPVPYKRVAIALDFSGRDTRVLSESLRLLAGQRPDEIALMHVVESATANVLGADAADLESARDSDRLANYADRLREFGYVVSTHIGRGRSVAELARMIGEFKADLVIVGAHGHRFFSDIFFGSTTDKLRHRVKASVFVVSAD